jgi:Ras-related C3 botulinum toxin substrate 1
MSSVVGRELKVLICGDGAIGKTCLLDTLCEKDVIDWESPEYKPTAADNLSRTWCDADNNDWEVSLWDTAGQEALVNLRRSAYPNTEVLLIGFDMTKGVSLENIPTWVAEVAETEENVGATILVGTKSDFYEEIKDSGKGSDGQPLKTIEEMYAMAVEVGAAAFVCTSAKNGYGLLQEAEEGAAVGAEGDTMSGQGEQYLDLHVLRCGKAVKNGDSIAALESRAKAAPAPVVEEKKPEKPKAPEPPKPVAPEAPKQAPAAPKPKPAKKEDGCCTLL